MQIGGRERDESEQPSWLAIKSVVFTVFVVFHFESPQPPPSQELLETWPSLATDPAIIKSDVSWSKCLKKCLHPLLACARQPRGRKLKVLRFVSFLL